MSRDVTTKEYMSSSASPTTSGASRVGVAAITGLVTGVATTVQAALADIVTQLGTKISTSRQITASGGVQGGGDMSQDRNFSLTDTAVTPSSYTLASITVDQKGRITSASNGSPGSVADASTTVKGAAKSSVAPASATNPIFTGDNDPRVIADQAAGAASIRTLGTGAQQACAGNDSRLLKQWEAVFYLSGTLTVKTGVGKYKLPSTGSPTITEVTIEVNQLPTGASVIADVNSINNSTNARTSLYTNQANRPTIAAGGNYSNVATLPNTTSLSAGTSISVDCDQIGSGTAGADLVVVVRGTA